MTVSAFAKSNYKGTIVSNQRWIRYNQLEVGMYITELDVPWENTPFMFQGFFVESQAQIDAVAEHSEYVLVKTEKIAARATNSSYSV